MQSELFPFTTGDRKEEDGTGVTFLWLLKAATRAEQSNCRRCCCRCRQTPPHLDDTFDGFFFLSGIESPEDCSQVVLFLSHLFLENLFIENHLLWSCKQLCQMVVGHVTLVNLFFSFACLGKTFHWLSLFFSNWEFLHAKNYGKFVLKGKYQRIFIGLASRNPEQQSYWSLQTVGAGVNWTLGNGALSAALVLFESHCNYCHQRWIPGCHVPLPVSKACADPLASADPADLTQNR